VREGSVVKSCTDCTQGTDNYEEKLTQSFKIKFFKNSYFLVGLSSGFEFSSNR